jgi:hypothetical protein
MSFSPRAIVAFIPYVGTFVTVIAAVAILLWTRIRARPLARLAKRIDDLAERQRQLEDLVATSGLGRADRAEVAAPCHKHPLPRPFRFARAPHTADGMPPGNAS